MGSWPAVTGVTMKVMARIRAPRFLAGLLIALLTIPLALSSPWAEALVFERATAWARGRYGIEIRAAAFDYRLTSLGARLSEVTVAARATPDRPFLRIAELDLDLAASALRGRLNFDGIRARHATIVLDPTTRPTGTVPAPTQPGTGATLPPFEVGVLQVEDLDSDARRRRRDSCGRPTALHAPERA